MQQGTLRQILARSIWCDFRSRHSFVFSRYHIARMAGRGRGATLPAWMTAGGAETSNGGNGAQYSAPSHHAPAGQFDDYNQPSRYPPAYSAPIVPSYSAPPPMQYNVGAPPVDHRNSGYSDRPHDDGRSGGRDVRKRSRSRSKYVNGFCASFCLFS